MHPGNSGRLCRDENCDRLGIHLKHKVTRKDNFHVKEISKSDEVPWKRSAPMALDESITNAASVVYPKSFEAIMRDVEGDYGSLARSGDHASSMRTVQRRLRKLVSEGHILRIDLGRRLFAYLKPGSNMTNDLDLMREQLEINMTTTRDEGLVERLSEAMAHA